MVPVVPRNIGNRRSSQSKVALLAASFTVKVSSLQILSATLVAGLPIYLTISSTLKEGSADEIAEMIVDYIVGKGALACDGQVPVDVVHKLDPHAWLNASGQLVS